MVASSSLGNPKVFLLFLIIGLLVAALLPLAQSGLNNVQTLVAKSATAETLPPLTEHALLHADAVEVWKWLNKNATDFCKYKCGDRVVFACRMPGGKFAFAVVDAVATITAFRADQGYAVNRTRNNAMCRPFMNAAHP